MMTATTTMEQFLREHAAEVERTDTGKVRFVLTGHECQAVLTAVEAYHNGRSYARAQAASKSQQHRSEFDFGEFGPHIHPVRFRRRS